MHALPTGLLFPENALASAPMTVVVLAPHPDDFDAIGITMRMLHAQGHAIHVAVLTSGANGVDEGWRGASGPLAKAALREAEQRESCRFFGLPAERLAFLRLWEDADDKPLDHASGNETLRQYLCTRRPQLVFLPHGNDSNRTHRRTWAAFHSIATQDGMRLRACLNLDAKTLSFRADLHVCFDEDEAAWKRQLLRLHQSQQERNLLARGVGFDERVLAVNRDAATRAGADLPYAEAFEVRDYG